MSTSSHRDHWVTPLGLLPRSRHESLLVQLELYRNLYVAPGRHVYELLHNSVPVQPKAAEMVNQGLVQEIRNQLHGCRSNCLILEDRDYSLAHGGGTEDFVFPFNGFRPVGAAFWKYVASLDKLIAQTEQWPPCPQRPYDWFSPLSVGIEESLREYGAENFRALLGYARIEPLEPELLSDLERAVNLFNLVLDQSQNSIRSCLVGTQAPQPQPLQDRDGPASDMRPDIPTAEYCLLPGRRVRWEGDTDELQPRLWDLFSFLVTAGEEVNEESAIAAAWDRNNNVSSKTVMNAVSSLNTALLAISFPWQWRYRQGKIIR